MSVFVLVHGAWHDGSAWKAVIQHLEAKGHQAFAPTIAGHGKGVDKNVNHAQCTQSIIDYIVDKDLTDIILLGHSFGGTIIPKVAEAISDRIRRLIFFAAPVLIDKLDLKQFYSLFIPKSYLYCTEDTSRPQGEWGYHPKMSSRLGLFRLVQMPGSHEVMFSNPVGLGENIIVAGRD